jgi:hypothetical protein
MISIVIVQMHSQRGAIAMNSLQIHETLSAIHRFEKDTSCCSHMIVYLGWIKNSKTVSRLVRRVGGSASYQSMHTASWLVIE